MKLNHNYAAVCADSITAQPGSRSAAEINLYGELTAFAELSPEEQMRLVERPETTSAETEVASTEEAPELVLTHRPIELVEAETTAAEIETPSPEEAEKPASPDPVLTQPPMEPSEAGTTIPAAASASDSEASPTNGGPREVRSQLVGGPRPSGPLSGFNLPADIVYTGALSRGVCLACGAESDANDLFCITCGAFIDEIRSTLPVKPTCAECKQGIVTNEIFCPWCGSVLPAS